MSPVTYARIGSEWFDLIYTRIMSIRETDPLAPITVLVPSYNSGIFTRRMLAARKPGLFNVNFIRIDDLSDLAGGGELTRLSTLRASQIVHAVIHDASDDELGILARSRDHPSLPVAIHRAFGELRPVSNEGLEELQRLDTSGLAGLVVDLWRKFKSRTTGFTDQLVSSEATATKIRAPGGVFKKRFGRTIVCLLEQPPPEFHPLLEALQDVDDVEWIIGATGEASLDDPLMRLAGVDTAGTSVSSVSSGSSVVPVELVSAPDPGEEIRTLVRKVLEIAAAGTRFGEMAVAFSDVSYAERVLEAFDRAGIPASGSNPRTLADMPEGRFLTGLLGVYATDFSREAFIDWIDGGLVVDLTKRPVPSVRWDLVSRQAGIVGGAGNWSEQLSRYSAAATRRSDRGLLREELSESQAARMRGDAHEALALADLQKEMVDAPPPESASWAGYVEWCRHALERFTLTKNAVDSGDRMTQVRSALDQIGQLDDIAGPEPDLSRFREILASELSSSLGRVGTLGRGVLIGHLRTLIGVPVNVLFVVGMSEGSFPSSVGDDPLLADGLRRQFNGDPGVLMTRAAREQTQRREFLTAMESAGRRIFMWPRSDIGSAAARGPARWFIEAARVVSGDDALQGGDLLHNDNSWFMDVIESPLHGMESAPSDGITNGSEYRLRSLSAHVSRGRPANDHWTVSADAIGALKIGLRVESNRFGPNWTEWDGKLVGESLPVPSVDSPISPTRLQSWAACPFSYFAGNILRLEGVDRPEEIITISALDRGTLLHAILEEFVEERIKSGTRPSREVATGRILEIADVEFDKFQADGMVGRRALWELEKERMRREAAQFVDAELAREAETGFTATATELKFGLGVDGHPAIELSLPSGRTVAFRGAIDRVERGANGELSVVDYKTGSLNAYKTMDDDPIAGGQRMQLPIYAMAARFIFGGDGEIEGSYWFTSERGAFQTRRVRLGDIEQEALATLDRITEGIGAGVFPAIPGPPGYGGFANCVYCEFDQICPTSRGRLWDLKSGASDIRAVMPPDDEIAP
ncbi:MAG: PD-(D/E)XK nuclease family protein [Chloroflexi bacterium]|nr:PD-(D/E)XK nuclease family protein [Chloroflexota bacterium]